MAIVPYEGLSSVVEEVSEKYSDEFDITIKVGELPKKLEFGVQAEKDGYDIIVSRGGTTELLKHILTIPVVNIEISGYDYMRAIKMATAISGKKAIVGYEKITANANSVLTLMAVDDIDIFTVNSRDEIRSTIVKLVSEGYQLVLGDVVTHRIAREVGINAMLITSGKESVTTAFNTAKWLKQSFESAKRKADIMSLMLKASPVLTCYMDKSRDILYGSGKIDEIGLTVPELRSLYQPNNSSSKQTVFYQKDNTFYKITFIPSDEPNDDGVIVQISSRRISERIGRGISIDRRNTGVQGTSELFGYCGIYDKRTIDEAVVFSRVNDPILLIGLPGIGKTRIANCIHKCSNEWEKAFINIDCRLADPVEALKELRLDADDSLAPEGGTVCLGNIQFVNSEVQHALFKMIGDRNDKRFRYICTASPELLRNPKNYDNSFISFFLLRLHISDVDYTEREMERFVNLSLIEYNRKYGKQIVKIDEEAMKLLLSHSWKTNFEELRQAVGQMVLSARGTNIQTDEVRSVLRDREPAISDSSLELNGTLDEIELKIMERVFKDEGENYSKAANRLGIARTTLWRKLANK